MRIGEVCLHTQDVNRLADFYKRLFQIDNGSRDDVHQFLFSEETTLTVYNDGTARSTNSGSISLAFTVDDVDQAYAQLQALGAAVLEPPTTRPWGARNLHFLDPDGNHIYFRSFPSET